MYVYIYIYTYTYILGLKNKSRFRSPTKSCADALARAASIPTSGDSPAKEVVKYMIKNRMAVLCTWNRYSLKTTGLMPCVAGTTWLDNQLRGAPWVLESGHGPKFDWPRSARWWRHQDIGSCQTLPTRGLGGTELGTTRAWCGKDDVHGFLQHLDLQRFRWLATATQPEGVHQEASDRGSLLHSPILAARSTLTGWWFQSSERNSQLGWLSPIYMEK